MAFVRCESFSRWLSDSFSVICKTFSFPNHSLALSDVCNCTNVAVWSYIVRHVMPKFRVLKIRNKLKAYYEHLAVPENDTYVSTIIDLCTLHGKKAFLEKLLIKRINDFDRFLKRSFAPPEYEWFSSTCVLEMTRHYVFSNMEFLNTSVVVIDSSIAKFLESCFDDEENRKCENIGALDSLFQNISKCLKQPDFQNFKNLSAHCDIQKKLFFSKDKLCRNLKEWVNFKIVLSAFFSKELLHRFEGESSYGKEKAVHSLGFELFGNSNFCLSSCINVQRLQSLHIRNYFKNKHLFIKLAEFYDEYNLLMKCFYSDETLKVKYSLINSDQFCVSLNECNDILKAYLDSMINFASSDFGCWRVIHSSELCHKVCTKKINANLMLKLNMYIVEQLFMKWKNLISNCSEHVELEDYASLNNVSELFFDTHTISVLYPQNLVTDNLIERHVFCTSLNYGSVLHGVLFINFELYFHSAFIWTLRKMFFKIIKLKNNFSICSVQLLKNPCSGVSDRLNRAVKLLENGEIYLAELKLFIFDWWEQSAGFIIDTDIEGKTVKEWSQILFIC